MNGFVKPRSGVQISPAAPFASPRRQYLLTAGRWFESGPGEPNFPTRRRLTLIHSVQNHADDDGNYGTTHAAADQLTSDRR